MTEIGTMLLKNRYDELRDYCTRNFGETLRKSVIKDICELAKLAQYDGKHRRTEDTWRCWLKSRVAENHGLKMGDFTADLENVVTAKMHVFFWWTVETDEQLERLRKPEYTIEATPAASRITKTNYRLTPINSVAGRVLKTDAEDCTGKTRI